jgi:hypothetical protein
LIEEKKGENGRKIHPNPFAIFFNNGREISRLSNFFMF